MGEWVSHLGREALLHILLHSAEEERLQCLVERGEGVGVALAIGTVSTLKPLPLRECAGHDEMEQRPQLLQRVLRGRERGLQHSNLISKSSLIIHN